MILWEDDRMILLLLFFLMQAGEDPLLVVKKLFHVPNEGNAASLYQDVVKKFDEQFKTQNPMNMTRIISSATFVRNDSEATAQTKKYLSDFKEGLTLLSRASVISGCYFTPEPPLSQLFESSQILKTSEDSITKLSLACHLAVFQGHIHEEGNHLQEAYRDYRLLLRVGSHLKQQWNLNFYLRGLSLCNLGLLEINYLISSNLMTPLHFVTITELQQDLEENSFFARTFFCEQLSYSAYLKESLIPFQEGSMSDEELQDLKLFPDDLKTLHFWIKNHETSWFEADLDQMEFRSKQFKQNTFPAYRNVIIARRRQEALQRGTKVLLAINQFILRTKKPPEKLEELVPNELSILPKDPFGEKFIYRIAEGKIQTLYSLGQNKTDDGGNADLDLLIYSKRP